MFWFSDGVDRHIINVAINGSILFFLMKLTSSSGKQYYKISSDVINIIRCKRNLNLPKHISCQLSEVHWTFFLKKTGPIIHFIRTEVPRYKFFINRSGLSKTRFIILYKLMSSSTTTVSAQHRLLYDDPLQTNRGN